MPLLRQEIGGTFSYSRTLVLIAARHCLRVRCDSSIVGLGHMDFQMMTETAKGRLMSVKRNICRVFRGARNLDGLRTILPGRTESRESVSERCSLSSTISQSTETPLVRHVLQQAGVIEHRLQDTC